jgi:hypothetical protein
MKNWKRALIGLLSIGVMAGSFPATLFAAGEYTYTVRFYAGNRGTFAGTGCVEVDNAVSGSDYSITTQDSNGTILVTGLKAGDRVSCYAARTDAMNLSEGDLYYVKGVRLSGQDNSTVGMSSFLVEGDADYVAAYGVLGDKTSYTVNYQDENGKTLADSETFYGNVGDRPVVAFRYIDGYEPKAYNLTKTLVSNAEENVFTFTYKLIPTDGGTTTTTRKITNNTTTYVTETGAPVTEAGTNNGAATGSSAGTTGGNGSSTVTANEGTDETGAEEEAIEEEEAPRELIDLDEEEAPRANLDLGGAEEAVSKSSKIVMIAIGAAAVLLIAFLAFLFAKKRREAEEDE